jgi:hypothetical protein
MILSLMDPSDLTQIADGTGENAPIHNIKIARAQHLKPARYHAVSWASPHLVGRLHVHRGDNRPIRNELNPLAQNLGFLAIVQYGRAPFRLVILFLPELLR